MATQRLPIRPEDHAAARTAGAADLTELLARQHYQLAWWQTADDDLNWRRFFTITELAGLRIEDKEVFEATHALYFRLYAEGLIDGLRIDHVDGLTDPAGYCRTLRARPRRQSERPRRPPQGRYRRIEKTSARARSLRPTGAVRRALPAMIQWSRSRPSCNERTAKKPLVLLWKIQRQAA